MDSNYTKAGYLTEPFKIFHLRDEHKLNIDFHYHDFHKILIHLHGNVSYCIEGRSYELKEHDIVLVNAGEVHKPILNDDSIYERIIIYVSQQLIDDYVSKGYDLACCFKQAYANQSHVLRLAATKGSRLADIGTDHGYIPIALVQEGRIPSALAMDVGKGPLSRAREHIHSQGLDTYIETRLSDGLTELHEGEADTVLIAGMGGMLMKRILEGGKRLHGCSAIFLL